MKKIAKLHIHNFQSHEDLTIDIAPMLTTLVGASDAGKSAVIRALRWALFNEPSGTQYIRVGTHDTFVRVEFSDGSSLLRARDRSENYYVLKDASGDSIRLEGFGVSVPVEVTNFTGIRKVQIGEKDSLAVNIAGQLEGPFLLGEKSAVRAEAIGRLAGTDRIDAAHRTANADRFSNQRRIGQLLLDEQKLEEQQKEYDYLPSLGEIINKLEKVREQAGDTQEKLKPLHLLRIRYLANLQELQQIRQRVSAFSGLSKAEKLSSEALFSSTQLTRLYQWQNRQRQSKESLEKAKQYIRNRAQFLDYIAQRDLVQKTERWERIRTLQERYHRWEDGYTQTKKKTEIRVEETAAAAEALQERSLRLQALLAVRNRYTDTMDRLKRGSAYYDRLKDLDQAEKYIHAGMDDLDRLRRLRSLQERYKTNLLTMKDAQVRQGRTAASLQTHLDAYMDQFQQTGQCPYCLQELDSQALTHLRTHLEREAE